VKISQKANATHQKHCLLSSFTTEFLISPPQADQPINGEHFEAA
jgi:hypothetical protein